MPSVAQSLNSSIRKSYTSPSPIFSRIDYAFKNKGGCGPFMRIVCIALAFISVIPALIELGGYLVFLCNKGRSNKQNPQEPQPQKHSHHLHPTTITTSRPSSPTKASKADQRVTDSASTVFSTSTTQPSLPEVTRRNPQIETSSASTVFPGAKPRPSSRKVITNKKVKSPPSSDKAADVQDLLKASWKSPDAYKTEWEKKLAEALDKVIWPKIYSDYACNSRYAYLRGNYIDLQAENHHDIQFWVAQPKKPSDEYIKHEKVDMNTFSEYTKESEWTMALSRKSSTDPRRCLMLLPPTRLAASNINTFLKLRKKDGNCIEPIYLARVLRDEIIKTAVKLKTREGLEELIKDNNLKTEDAQYVRKNFKNQHITISTDGKGVDYLHIRFEFFDPDGPAGQRGPKYYNVPGDEPEAPAAPKAPAPKSGGLTLVKGRGKMHQPLNEAEAKMFRPLPGEAGPQTLVRSPSVETPSGHEGPPLTLAKFPQGPVRPPAIRFREDLTPGGPSLVKSTPAAEDVTEVSTEVKFEAAKAHIEAELHRAFSTIKRLMKLKGGAKPSSLLSTPFNINKPKEFSFYVKRERAFSTPSEISRYDAYFYTPAPDGIKQPHHKRDPNTWSVFPDTTDKITLTPPTKDYPFGSISHFMECASEEQVNTLVEKILDQMKVLAKTHKSFHVLSFTRDDRQFLNIIFEDEDDTCYLRSKDKKSHAQVQESRFRMKEQYTEVAERKPLKLKAKEAGDEGQVPDLLCMFRGSGVKPPGSTNVNQKYGLGRLRRAHQQQQREEARLRQKELDERKRVAEQKALEAELAAEQAR